MAHNEVMRYGALLGWGIVIYAVIALAWSGLMIYELDGSIVGLVFELFVLITVTVVAGRSLRYDSWRDILPYSCGWALVMALLDAVYSVPFSGWDIYSDWSIWAGYAMVVFLPLIAHKTRAHKDIHEYQS